ncbi:hypothetical protein KOR42_06240 [Thalassoglobus neptunius]|uniref:HTH merR-type domain-containing protein n=1 Tax=Thalassoglobus neptunius TaxID=1938619 RepID=A0A5C5X2U1_9PLAN|nr:hypothetical protein [Thalassoglobus neptunius]TWT57266.1 hypothetical protein KOR42_06240 [Thalassoglobus neptunius]
MTNVKGMSTEIGNQTQNSPSPVLQLGQLWRRCELLQQMGIGENTLKRWEIAGLPALKAGTREKYYLSDDVIQVMRKCATEGVPKLVPDYKRQQE